MGLELARRLLERDRRNTVIVTGRSDEKLESATRALPGVHAFKSDVGDPAASASLRDDVIARFPALDTLINNAGIMRCRSLTKTRRWRTSRAKSRCALLGRFG